MHGSIDITPWHDTVSSPLHTSPRRKHTSADVKSDETKSEMNEIQIDGEEVGREKKIENTKSRKRDNVKWNRNKENEELD